MAGFDITASPSKPASSTYHQRFKRNIEKIESEDALNMILQLEGVSYDLNFTELWSLNLMGTKDSIVDDGPQQRQVGFIAQDVEKVLPEIIYTDEVGWKGLHYARLAPILVESLKQLTSELLELKETVLQLTTELEKMKNAHPTL